MHPVFNNDGVSDGPLVLNTTGFLGLATLIPTSTSTFTTAITFFNGFFSSYRTKSATTVTRTYSGMSHIGLSTFQTTATYTITGTVIFNGLLTTCNSTAISVGTTMLAMLVNAAPVGNVIRVSKKALFVFAGAALAHL
jgi:hypothetical protein